MASVLSRGIDFSTSTWHAANRIDRPLKESVPSLAQWCYIAGFGNSIVHDLAVHEVMVVAIDCKVHGSSSNAPLAVVIG